MLFLPKWMGNNMCWQRRKGIRQTAWQSKLISFCSVWREVGNLTAQPCTSSQPPPPPSPFDTHRKSLTKDIQTSMLTNAMITSIHKVIPLTSACASLNERQIGFGTETWKTNENEILMQILSEKSEIQTWICLFLTSLKRGSLFNYTLCEQ